MTYTWSITQVKNRTRDGMIYEVIYKITGVKGSFKVSLDRVIRFVQSDAPTPYNSVTEEQIVGWVKAKLGSTRENALYTLLEKEMAKKEAPIEDHNHLPWS